MLVIDDTRRPFHLSGYLIHLVLSPLPDSTVSGHVLDARVTAASALVHAVSFLARRRSLDSSPPVLRSNTASRKTPSAANTRTKRPSPTSSSGL